MVRTGGVDQRILLSAQTAKQRARFTQSDIAQETGAPLKRFFELDPQGPARGVAGDRGLARAAFTRS